MTLKDLENILSEKSVENSNRLTSSDIDIDSDDKDAQVKMWNLELKRFKSDTKDRKWLAKWSTWVVSIWLILVFIILVLNKILNFDLSDAVLITLLGTTTLNILGLSFIVLRGHFYSVNGKH